MAFDDTTQHTDETPTAAPEGQRSTSSIPTAAQLAVALSILGAVFAAPQFFNGDDGTPDVGIQAAAAPIEPVARRAAPVPEEVAIEAKAAFVWDVERQRALYNKNADEQLPLASLTKLMTALVASEVLGAERSVAMTFEAVMQEGESGFYIGEEFSAENLRNFMLVSSSNDGAYALAAAAGVSLALNKEPQQAFVDMMNIRAEQLGLVRTHFDNPTGLDTDFERSGSYGTARDMAFLLEYLLKNHPEVLEPTTETYTLAETNFASHTATNTNEIVTAISGLLGSKTGFTDLAGGNLAIAYNAGLNRPIVVVVLGSTRDGRFRDTLTLIEYANRYLASL